MKNYVNLKGLKASKYFDDPFHSLLAELLQVFVTMVFGV